MSEEISASDLGLGGENVVEEYVDEVETVVDEQIEQEAAPEQEETTETQEARPVPQSWKKEYGDYWNQLDPKVQEIFETREKQMADGLEQYRQYAGIGKQINEVVTPYQQFLQQQGVDVPTAVQHLLNAHYTLTSASPEEKQRYFNQLAESYGLSQKSENADPTIKALQDQIAGIQQNLTARERASQAEARSKAAKEVEQFATDNPYFDDVADDIVPFINAGLDLKSAYEKAVWANPVTREKEIARLQEESQKTLQAKAKAEAEAAKKSTSANIRSRDTRKAPTELTGTMEETMRQTLQEIRGRTH